MQTQDARDVLMDIIQKYGSDKKLPKLSFDTIEGIYHYAYQYYIHGKYPEAVKFFRFLTLVDTQQKKHWMGLGAALQMSKEYEEALHTYSVSAILEERDPYVHLYAADCFFALDRVNEGLGALESAIKAAKMKKLYQSLLPELEVLREAWEKRRVS